MSEKLLLHAIDVDSNRLFIEVPKHRWHFSVTDDVAAHLKQYEPGAELLTNQVYGWWGALTRLKLLRTVAQLPDVIGGEVVHGVTVSEALWSDRALVAIPHSSERTALAAGVIAHCNGLH